MQNWSAITCSYLKSYACSTTLRCNPAAQKSKFHACAQAHPLPSPQLYSWHMCRSLTMKLLMGSRPGAVQVSRLTGQPLAGDASAAAQHTGGRFLLSQRLPGASHCTGAASTPHSYAELNTRVPCHQPQLCSLEDSILTMDDASDQSPLVHTLTITHPPTNHPPLSPTPPSSPLPPGSTHGCLLRSHRLGSLPAHVHDTEGCMTGWGGGVL